ncbi:MAG: T9SS type A sorting domain-containing protein [bacterium]|nr:T9SS type A sorting domain-containing protein [bacterium]
MYNAAGRLVETLVNGETEPGYYRVKWDAKGFPAGIYFAKFVSGNYTKIQKLILMR